MTRRGSARISRPASTPAPSKREWPWQTIGVIAAIVTPILTIIGQLIYFQGAVTTSLTTMSDRFVKSDSLGSRVNDAVNGRFGSLESRLEALDTRLNSLDSDLRSKFLALQAEGAARDPELPESQAVAKQAVAEARESGAGIDNAALQKVGTAFIDAAQGDEGAWSTALDYVSYRTSRNTLEVRFEFGPVTPDRGTLNYYAGPLVDSKPMPRMNAAMVQVPADQSALYEDIGQSLNTDLSVGVPVLRMQGGAVRLDGKRIRQVIFQDVEIHYDGGPTDLKAVFFVNCRFVMNNSEPTRKLAVELLATADTIDFANPV